MKTFDVGEEILGRDGQPMSDGTRNCDFAWSVEIPPSTRCKHGKGPCAKCGTTDERDVVHSARTPNNRDARRARRKAKRKANP